MRPHRMEIAARIMCETKAFSLVMIVSLLASMTMIGIGTAGVYTPGATPKFLIKLPNGTQFSNTTVPTPYDWMMFDVGYILTLSDMVSVKSCVEPVAWEAFEKCEYVSFNVTITNIDWVWHNTVITLVVYDDNQVPIGTVIETFSVPPGEFCSPRSITICVSLYIPKYAYVGAGTGYINAFTAIPSECGLPWCPEVSDSFLIQKAAP